MSFHILTVCTGNICRSPMAEFMLQNAADSTDAPITVSSVGITGWEAGNSIDPRAAKVLHTHGVEPAEHTAREITETDYREADLILALDTNHYEHLMSHAPDQQARDKVKMLRSFDPRVSDAPAKKLGIYDPWYGDESDFEQTWDMIDPAIEPIIEYARANIHHH